VIDLAFHQQLNFYYSVNSCFNSAICYWITNLAFELIANLIVAVGLLVGSVIGFSEEICCFPFVAELSFADWNSWLLAARSHQIYFWTKLRKIHKYSNFEMTVFQICCRIWYTYFDILLISGWKVLHMSFVHFFAQ